MARSIDTLKNGFKLIQDDRFFKLSMDSVMLSEFAKVNNNMKICDLGCGNGVLTLLLLQKNQKIHVDALEIQDEVAELANENIILNKMEEKAKIYQGNMKYVSEILPCHSYDYVITNPPYFKLGSGPETVAPNKFTARFEEDLTIDDIISAGNYLLKYGGKFAIVHKAERMCEIICAMEKQNIIPKRIRFVHNKITSKPSVVMIEGRKGSGHGVIIEPPFILRNEDNTYTDEYTKTYYE